MKLECSIVQDLLPLYAENMVSEATAGFVKEHLAGCQDCRAALAALTGAAPATLPSEALQEAQAFTLVKKKLRKRVRAAALTTAVLLLAAVVLLQLFPVYRLAKVQITCDFTSRELADLAYIGTPGDRLAAQAVLRQADAAFADCRRTHEEQQQLYGPLARYATAAERGAAFTEYTLELWSAHLGKDTGTLWVYYTHHAYDAGGGVVCGSSNIPSYWTVEKNADGQWVVTDIKERA